jgi:hypothetical protein
LLGVLGMGARIPYSILELGSRTDSVPSWQGGKLGFGAQFGQSNRLGRAAGKSNREDIHRSRI